MSLRPVITRILNSSYFKGPILKLDTFSNILVSRKLSSTMGRRPCCDKVGLKRGPWTVDEDHKLINFILSNGIHCWRTVPKLAGLLRCGKSCRLRWINYLRPDLKRGDFSEAEEDQIIQLHSRLGNRWSKIAANFPGRTDNEIKNHWNTKIKKRLKQIGSDPIQETQQIDDKNLVSNKEPDFSEKVESEPKMDQTSDLFENNYDLLWGSFESATTDKEVNDKNNSNTCTSSYTSSISVEESANASDQTQSSLQLQQWVESVDSILSWDFFDQIDEDWFSWNTQ